MDSLLTSSLSAPAPSTTQQGYSWTNADQIDVAQICRDLGISEESIFLPVAPAEVNLSALTPTSQLPSHPSTPTPTTKIRLKRKATANPGKGRINAPRRSNGQFEKVNDIISEIAPKSCASHSTSSTTVAATWTSEPIDPLAISETSGIARPSSTDIASLVYSTYILQHLNSDSKSQSSLELQLRKNIFLKYYYTQLISFVDSALAAQHSLSYKSLDSIILSALKFLGFN